MRAPVRTRLAYLPPSPSQPRPVRFLPRRAAGGPHRRAPDKVSLNSAASPGATGARVSLLLFLHPPPRPSAKGKSSTYCSRNERKPAPGAPAPARETLPNAAAAAAAATTGGRHRYQPLGKVPGGREQVAKERNQQQPPQRLQPLPFSGLSSQSPPLRRPVGPAPPAPPHTEPVSPSGAGRGAPAPSERAAPPTAGRGEQGKAGCVRQAPLPRPPPPLPRPRASRFAPAFPAPHWGTRRRAPRIEGGGGFPLVSRLPREAGGRGCNGVLPCGAVGTSRCRPSAVGGARPAGLYTRDRLSRRPLGSCRPRRRAWVAWAATSRRAGDRLVALALGGERRGTGPSTLSARCRARAFPRAGMSGRDRSRMVVEGRFLLGGDGWPLGWNPALGLLACSTCPLVLPTINFPGVVLASLTLPLAEPRAGQRGAGQGLRCRRSSRRGLCRRLGSTRGAWSARLRGSTEPVRDGRIRMSETVWDQSEPCAEFTEEYQIRPCAARAEGPAVVRGQQAAFLSR